MGRQQALPQQAVGTRKRPAGDRDDWPVPTRVAARYELGLSYAIRDAFVQGLLWVDAPYLERQVGLGNVDGLYEALRLVQSDRLVVEAARRQLLTVYLAGVEVAGQALERVGVVIHRSLVAIEKRPLGVSLDAVNPEAVAWARTHAGELVVAPREVREFINTLVLSSQALKLTPQELARRIYQLSKVGILGLDKRRMNAVANFEEGLRREGVTGAALDRRVARYADAQRRARAILIARTETISALSHGQEALWKQAAGQGLIDRRIMGKIWIVAHDDVLCRICERLADTVVPLDDLFGGVVSGPPRHPACRCAIGLAPLIKGIV